MVFHPFLIAALLAAAPDPAPLAGAVVVVDPGHGGQRYSKSYTGGTRGVDSKLHASMLGERTFVFKAARKAARQRPPQSSC